MALVSTKGSQLGAFAWLSCPFLHFCSDMNTFYKVALVGSLFSALNCTSKPDVTPELNFCNQAKSYKDIAWLNTSIETVKKNNAYVGTEYTYYLYKGQGYIERNIPVTSMHPDGIYTCEGQLSQVDLSDFWANRTNKQLIWKYER